MTTTEWAWEDRMEGQMALGAWADGTVVPLGEAVGHLSSAEEEA
jgi:hypothetical protein